MPLLDEVMKEALRLVEECPVIATATGRDCIYDTFSQPPYLLPEDANEGVWMSVNKKLDGVFGSDTGHENFRKGPDGLALVIEWVNKAREHPSWDSPEDKERRIHKKGKYDSGSDLIIKFKFERICKRVKGKPSQLFFFFAIIQI